MNNSRDNVDLFIALSDTSDLGSAVSKSFPVKKSVGVEEAVIDDGPPNTEIKDLVVRLTPSQYGSGDPSSENVQPVHGWNKIVVTKAKRNIFIPDSQQPTLRRYIGQTGSYYYLKYNSTSPPSTFCTYIPCRPDTTYTVSVREPDPDSPIINVFRIGYISEDLPTGSGYSPQVFGRREWTSGNPLKLTLTTGSEAQYLIINVPTTAMPWSGATKDIKIQVEFGDTAHEYEPYACENYEVDIPDTINGGTVYGGVYDAYSGKLTVTHANIAAYAGETINEPWLSSMDVFSTGGTPTTGAQVVYPLDTPVEYDIDAINPVFTNFGDYTAIFANCGALDVVGYHQYGDECFDWPAVKAAFCGTSIIRGEIHTLIGGNDTVTICNHTLPKMYAKARHIQAENRGVGGQGLIAAWNTIYGANGYKEEGYQFDGCDLLVCNWNSANDGTAFAAMPLGANETDASDTILKRFGLFIVKMHTFYPTMSIVWIGPTGNWTGTTPPVYSGTYAGGGTSFSLNDFADGLKSLCARHRIGFIDFREVNHINPQNLSAVLCYDKVHFTEEGYRKYTEICIAGIDRCYSAVE